VVPSVKRERVPSFEKAARVSSLFIHRTKGKVGGWKNKFGVLRHSVLPASSARSSSPVVIPDDETPVLESISLETPATSFEGPRDPPDVEITGVDECGTALGWHTHPKSKARNVRGRADRLAAPHSEAPPKGLPTRHGQQVLHLFSGPSPRKDGLASYLRACCPPIVTTDVDIVNEHLDDQDLVDDAVWTRIRQRLVNGDFAFVFAGPPCRTFSDARLHRPGPPVLRDHEFLYGFPKSQAKLHGLRPEHFEQIRIDNLLAERTAEACSIMHQCGHGYAVEQPLGSKTSSVSMFDLQCFVELKKLGAKSVDFHQCMFGAASTKPTRFLYWNGRFETLESTCNHPRTVEVTPGVWTAHPAIVGIKDENGRFKTRASAAYPERLNRWVAAVINLAVSRPAPC